jgi:hypothetical protein
MIDFQIGIGSAKDMRMWHSEPAFISMNGLYEYTVRYFRLTNALAYYMDLMNKDFMEFLHKFVIVFIDGILVYSKSKEEHEEHLCLVLQKPQDHRSYAKLSKCEFGWSKFLSWVMSFRKKECRGFKKDLKYVKMEYTR